MSLASPLVATGSVPGPLPPLRLVHAGSALLILLLLAACAIVLFRLREDALRDTERHLSAMALTLAEQADRAVQGMDLVLDGIGRLSIGQGAMDAPSFDRAMSTWDVHAQLRERLIGLPQLNALIYLAWTDTW